MVRGFTQHGDRGFTQDSQSFDKFCRDMLQKDIRKAFTPTHRSNNYPQGNVEVMEI